MVHGPCVIVKTWTTSRLRFGQMLPYSGAECIRPNPRNGGHGSRTIALTCHVLPSNTLAVVDTDTHCSIVPICNGLISGGLLALGLESSLS